MLQVPCLRSCACAVDCVPKNIQSCKNWVQSMHYLKRCDSCSVKPCTQSMDVIRLRHPRSLPPSLPPTHTRHRCYPGTFSASSSLASPAECDVCPGGFYCAGAGAGVSGPCSPGHYCPPGSSSPSAFACPAGAYSTSTALSSVDGCAPCPIGAACPAPGTTTPIACAPGMYGNVTGAQVCIACPSGDECVGAAAPPSPCGVGSYSGPGASVCTNCSVGFACSTSGIPSSSLPLYACGAGLWCPAGMLSAPDWTNNGE